MGPAGCIGGFQDQKENRTSTSKSIATWRQWVGQQCKIYLGFRLLNRKMGIIYHETSESLGQVTS